MMIHYSASSPPTICGPGSIPGPGVICGLSLLLILSKLHFSLGTLVFPSPEKANIPKFQFDPESEGHRFVSRKTVRCYPC